MAPGLFGKRQAGLPQATGHRLDLLFGRGEILGDAAAIVDQDVWLMLTHHRIERDGLHCYAIQRPVDVVPEQIDLSVVAHQFAHQAVGIAYETLPRGFVGGTGDAVGVMPVHQRIIQANLEALGAAGLDHFAHEVTTRTTLDRVMRRDLGIPQAVAFVMFGGEHQVLHPGGLGHARPGPGAVHARVPLIR